MSGTDIPSETISLVIVASIALVAITLFSDLSASSVAIQQGDPLYETQHGLLQSIADLLPHLVGGIGVALTAVWILARGVGR